jgi:hypothetical protein
MRKALALLILFATYALGQTGQYIGAGGCASSNCHGGTSPLPEAQSRILGNEYSIWSVRDKHGKAYSVLANDRSKRMGEILRVGNPQTAERCTVCHAVGSPVKLVTDGVACEGCHGPAEKWLGPHTQANVPHANNVSLGMRDTKDLAIRVNMCLECHLGAGNKNVDHDLIAAGHPDLVFELDTFSAALPMHWREPKPGPGNSLPRVREWAVGQATALADGMRQLAARATANTWPEFAELECYQCHHDLRAESWRIQRGYGGRRPGSLQPNLARQDVVRVLVAQAAKEQSGALDSALAQLTTAMASRLSDGAAIAQAARSVAQQADGIAARFGKQDFDAATARGIAKALTADVARIANSGPHSAEQVTMSLDALGSATSGASAQAFQASIAKLYDYLEHPSAYNPGEFAAQFRKIAAQLN